MFKKIADGFMFTVGAYLAVHAIGFIDGFARINFSKEEDSTEE